MNKFVKQMLMQKHGMGGMDSAMDGRNPYGSRGGYVTSRRGRRDRDMSDYGDYGEDYARFDVRMVDERGYDRQSDGRNDRRSDGRYDRDSRRGYDRAGNDYGDYRSYDSRDYADYDRDRGYDRDYARDYASGEYGKLSREDIKKWEKSLHNADNSSGAHYSKEQAEQAMRQIGVKSEEIKPETFAMALNMVYADYCQVAKKYGVDRTDYYAEIAKAFLMDKDFEGEPEEKLWLYYKCIAESEE